MKVYQLGCGRWLNEKAFIDYFERKVRKTIRKFNLISKGDKIAVACSGGKDSLTLVYLLHKLYSRTHSIIALSIDEGIPGYREKLLKKGAAFCKKHKIPFKLFSFKKEFGFMLKTITKQIKTLKLSNCYVCSVLKRWLLNKKAHELNCNLVATAHSLDDEAESILLNQLKGNPQLLARLGPATGVIRANRESFFVQRIKPFYLCSTKEIVLYAKLNKLPISRAVCPLRGTTLRIEIRNWLSKLEKEHREVKNAIVQSFLKLMPLLKEHYRALEFKRCKRCGFPASKEVCKACELLQALNSTRV